VNDVPQRYDRRRIGELLSAAKESQIQYWDALGDLERALNCEIEGETIGTHDVDTLIALAEGSDGTETDSDQAAG
jgi:hypothetical protein